MKLLVFAHRLEIGGTQTNAIELAAELRDRHGFDILVHATPGPMQAMLEARGLRFAAAPDARFHPSMSRILRLRELLRTEKPDLIHAWDWWQGLEAYLAGGLGRRVPVLISDMMMNLTRVLPRGLPTTFGTKSTMDAAVRAGWRRAHLLPPPVDTVSNAPGAVDGAAYRSALGLPGDCVLAVIVSRLAEFMKAEGVLRAIEAIRQLGPKRLLTLLVIGNGAARERIAALAEEVNRALRRRAVIVPGAMLDPRPAYAAADVVLGMGGSALRGLAFGKPVVVLGAAGFAQTFSPETAPLFVDQGFYGHGDGEPGAGPLAGCLDALAGDAGLRSALGAFGRSFVVENHGLEMLGGRLADLCRDAVKLSPSRSEVLRDAARSTYFYLRDRRFLTPSRDAHARPAAPATKAAAPPVAAERSAL